MNPRNFKTLILSAVFASSLSVAGPNGNSGPPLESPFPSTVTGLEIPNAHEITPQIFRGSAPGAHTQQLKDLGFTHVVIYKVQTASEVDAEKSDLLHLGFKKKNIRHIPMKWKNISSFRTPCRQTIDALKALLTLPADGKAYFHCTFGEDRTGVLAALVRMLTPSDGAQAWTKSRAFTDEMCRWGYEAGDGNKPDEISQLVREALTPFYLKMASLIESGKITATSFPLSVCDSEPKIPSAVLTQGPVPHLRWICETSPDFPTTSTTSKDTSLLKKTRSLWLERNLAGTL